MSSLLLSSDGVLDMIARLTVFLLAAIAQRAMDEPKLWLMQTKVNTFWDSIHIGLDVHGCQSTTTSPPRYNTLSSL